MYSYNKIVIIFIHKEKKLIRQKVRQYSKMCYYRYQVPTNTHLYKYNILYMCVLLCIYTYIYICKYEYMNDLEYN